MNLTTSGKLHPKLSYRLAATDKAIKVTFALKIGSATMPIPIQIANPFYQPSARPARQSKADG